MKVLSEGKSPSGGSQLMDSHGQIRSKISPLSFPTNRWQYTVLTFPSRHPFSVGSGETEACKYNPQTPQSSAPPLLWQSGSPHVVSSYSGCLQRQSATSHLWSLHWGWLEAAFSEILPFPLIWILTLGNLSLYT